MVTRTAACVGVFLGGLVGACGGQKTDAAALQADRNQRSEGVQPDGRGADEPRSQGEGGTAAHGPSAGGSVGRGGGLPFAAATAGTSASDEGTSAGGEAANEARNGENAPPSQSAYPGRGFVVHEWGTNTVVSGSDGSLQMGLHHEEEDLPPFVYDRLKTAVAEPNLDPVQGNIHVKMETPVLYFYSERALTAHAAVRFPRGVFTQWFPGVAWFRPPIEWMGVNSPGSTSPQDPALDAKVVVRTAHCEDVYRNNGVLDWGAFEVLAPGSEPQGLPEAPLAAYTWSHAREVAANLVRFPDAESERFLFYRGLANLELPAQTKALGGGRLSLVNSGHTALGPAFVIDVRGDSGAFRTYPEGVPAGATLSASAPDSFAPLPEYMAALGKAVTAALASQGLYTDESRAMVNTWQRQWFGTPGLRVLYLAPQSWTESNLPLTLDPIPESLIRVMMVRVEVLTPELEAADVAALESMERDAAAGRAHFAAAGRFAEPRLRRALALAPGAAGQLYLSEIATRVPRTGGSTE